ncbi:MAG: ATP-binding cassette domain-containing protein [marine benthic group bacterium]|nr:ATP-binding cassette domain-containing protein [Gemmatimonadota bacterium]MCL7961218.1 ATP-binding cassette domain-containing protein [Candidatus Carthagonibacter metallireducens]MCL7966861.1 ATP-binding cassette domain-containing protein [Gemmatimonadota bacterium]MCL7980158.1 ATP-binding cassette domain-containing protein [Gemmatimonadota bacterium]MCL7981260.1 ATP-binding cassette domain-containing protein [Gemmatimonadota bacterium]
MKAGESGQTRSPATDCVLRAENVTRRYERGRAGPIRARKSEGFEAVHGVDLSVHAGETVGLVGRSGSGKSTLARLMLGLEEPDSGKATWRGRDIAHLDRDSTLAFRREVQVVFQDPYGSLNPRHTVGKALQEVISFHRDAAGAEAQRSVRDLLSLVGLPPESARSYPHEFSGGQRQRIAIARALAVEPGLIVADEPVSALDVSVQAQILNLLIDLRERFDMALLLIAHDLSVVRHLASRVAVMHDGRIVEHGPASDVLSAPRHPATRELLAFASTRGRSFP